MASKLIISKDARFMGKTLEEMAKIERKSEPVRNNLSQKNVKAEDIVKIAPRSAGLTQKQAVEDANHRNLVLVSNTWADKDLNINDGINKRDDTYAIWTGTLIAYRKPGEKLGSEITYTDSQTSETYIFRVPVQYQNESNCALAVQHSIMENGASNITYHAIQKGAGIAYEIHVTDESAIQLIRNFPAKNGWYIPENSCGIPVGSGADSSNDAARHLWRIENGSYIGLVARGVDYGDGLRSVYACDGPSYRLGVLAQKTE